MKRYCILVRTRNGTTFYVGPRTLTSFPESYNSWERREFAEFKLSELQHAHLQDLQAATYAMDVYEFLVPDPETL